jgi:hypothetical protein
MRMELESLRFAQIIDVDDKAYQVVRTWDGATVRVAAQHFGRKRALLRYDVTTGEVVLGHRVGPAGFGGAQDDDSLVSAG